MAATSALWAAGRVGALHVLPALLSLLCLWCTCGRGQAALLPLMADQTGNDAAVAFDGRIPVWDGRPSTFPTFETEVEWWLPGENLKQPFNVAVRFINKQQGSAKVRGRTLKPDDLLPRPAVYDPDDDKVVLEVAEKW